MSTRGWAHRRGHDDLGDHYLDCGDLSNALKCYSRARDYCTSAKHVINMCLNVIKVGPGVGGVGGAAGQRCWWARRGCPRLSPSPARQVSVYLQNWSHVLSYVSKAESTPEIAEVTPALGPGPRSPDRCRLPRAWSFWPLLFLGGAGPAVGKGLGATGCSRAHPSPAAAWGA